MQTSFYASGFLYSLKTRQILLLQSQQKDDLVWSTIGGEGIEGEEALEAFRRIVQRILNIDLKTKNIYPVYDYFHEPLNKINYVFYAEIKSPKVFNSLKKDFSWVSFSETLKMLFSAQTKQDVIVGERVINLKWRQSQELQTKLSGAGEGS